LEIAKKGGQEEPMEAPSSSFVGSGYRLGDASSSSIPATPAVVNAKPPAVVDRILTFWRNGFSIDDGPLLKFDDPENEEFLNAIKMGVAPIQFLKVNPGDQVQVKVAHRMDTDYVQEHKPAKAYSGQGYRLGSVVPGESSVANASSSMTSSNASSTNTSSSMTVDVSLPTTSIQIRMADGTRLVVKCNHVHSLRDIVGFIKNSRPGESTRAFTLSTSHPVTVLADLDKSVKDYGLLNSVIVQRYI
jgi:UBX domain-containing protein 1